MGQSPLLRASPSQNKLRGDLPLSIIRLIARGCEVALSGDEMAFSLPANLGELGGDVRQLDLRGSSLIGSVPASLARLTNLRRLELANNDGLGGAALAKQERALSLLGNHPTPPAQARFR